MTKAKKVTKKKFNLSFKKLGFTILMTKAKKVTKKINQFKL
jgi:hypothetical protein